MARSVIGIPVFAGGAHVGEALSSLFRQSDRDVAFVLVDDGADEETAARASSLAGQEPRATYVRNDRRLGLVANWNRTFHLARELHPEAAYFAWASDHDVWHPDWLRSLVEALEAEPAAVLAYPFGARLVGGEIRVREHPRLLDTRGERRPLARLAATTRNVNAGWMVYGLYRSETLGRTGLLRKVLLPDRLLLLELSLLGPFVQVPEVLWQRRHKREAIPAHQRTTLFGARAPLQARLPHWLVHAAVLGARCRPDAGVLYPLFWARRELDDASRHLRSRGHGLRRRLTRRPA